MTASPDGHPGAAEIEAARLVLERMGVSPADLLGSTQQRSPAPTFDEYIPKVSSAVTAGTRRVYSSYWKRIQQHWGHRRLDEPTALEIKQLAEHIRTHVVARRNARGGRRAAEHLIAALRCVYNHAVIDGLIAESDNPARRVPKPRRLPSTRRGLPDTGLEEINRVAATTGNDPALDGCTPRQPAAAAARSPYARTISIPPNVWCCCRRKATRCAGSPSPPP